MFAACDAKRLQRNVMRRIVNLCCIVTLKKRIIPIPEKKSASVKSIRQERTLRKI